MDSIRLGKKIKEARLAKKMTQSDVVGSFITRNMLSQIENGTAVPSIKTLEYLSRVLEMPIHQLMPETNISNDYENLNRDDTESLLELLIGGKELLQKGHLSDAAVIFERLIGNKYLNDEALALMAQTLLGLAGQFYETGYYNQAAQASKQASEYSGKGFYANRETRTAALLLLDEISEDIAKSKSL